MFFFHKDKNPSLPVVVVSRLNNCNMIFSYDEK